MEYLESKGREGFSQVIKGWNLLKKIFKNQFLEMIPKNHGIFFKIILEDNLRK